MSEHERMGPPAVEPLSEIAWHRVEKSLFATLDCDVAVPAHAPSRRWRGWAIGGGAVALAAAAILLLVLRTPPAAPAGEAAATRPTAPSRVVTQATPTAVQFGDAAITIGAQSALTLHGNADDGVLIVLERGAAGFEVAPRAGRPPFVLQAGDVSVRVVGTRFTVSRSGDAASVEVTEGHVEVVARGRRVQLYAGDSWSSDGDREAAVDGSATPPGGLAAAPFDADAAVAPAPPDAAAPADAAVAPAPAVDKRVKATRPARDGKAAFERAAALEATDPRAALRAYRSLASERGPWAANALYAAGRLAAELRDREAAVKLLGEYVRRYPSGGNAADARALLRSLEPR